MNRGGHKSGSSKPPPPPNEGDDEGPREWKTTKQPEAKGPLFEFIRYTEFKRLLGQISTTLDRDGLKTVAVLSEMPGEGKTFFVSALALGYSLLLNRKVLVVNTTNQPQGRELFHRTIFQKESESMARPGEVVAVSRTIDLLSPFQDEDGAIEESSDFQMGQYIRAVQDSYDLVLFDTCAMSTSGSSNMDPIIIARQVDTSILLFSDRSLNRQALPSIKDKLGQWGVRLLGMIYNAGPKPEEQVRKAKAKS
jgi:Mrp family chromosome partitioning ATPase